MSVIINPIKDVIDWVGETIEDVADFVIDDIIDPVIETVSDVVDAALDDPIKTIATVAAVATGNAWAIPLIEGADVAIDGGDVGDVLEATAKAYVAQQVGAAAGKYVGSAAASEVAAAGGTAGEQAVAQAVVGRGTARATQAAIYGQDPIEAFAKGGISGGISASLGQLEQNSEYKNLPQAAKNVIEDSLTATLTGQEVTPELLTSAVVRGTVTADLVHKQLDPDSYYFDEFGDKASRKFTDGQIAAITNAIVNTTTAALAGRDITPALMKSILKYGSEELNKSIDKRVRNTIDKVSGDYDKLEGKATQIDDTVADYETAAANYNAVADGLSTKFEERDRLKSNIDTARATFESNPSQGNADTLNDAIKTYNDYTVALDKDYADNIKPLLDQYKTEADTKLASLETFRTEYNTLKDDLVSSGDQLDDVLKPVQKSVDKAFVRALTDNTFVPDEYIKFNNLDDDAAVAGEDFDPHYHWLTEGKENRLPTNEKEYNKAFDLEKKEFLDKALNKANLNLSHLNKEQRQNIIKQVDTIAEEYQNDLVAFRNADPSNYSEQITKDYLNDQQFLKDVLKSQGRTDAEINAYINKQKFVNQTLHTLSTYPKDKIDKSNVTEEEIVTNNAYLDMDAEGNISWLNSRSRDTEFYWDSTFNERVKRVATSNGYSIVNANNEELVKVERLPKITAEELLKTNPESGIINYAEIQDEKARNIIQAGVGNATWMFIQQAYEYAKKDDAPEFLKDTAGVVLSAGGELIQSFNGLLVLANINPETTEAGKFARKLINLGNDVKSESYKNNLKDIQQTIADANKDTDPNAPWYERAWNTTKAIYDGAAKAPGTFIAEYIVKEVIQEVPLLIASGGTANVARRVLMEGGEQYAKRMALRTGVGTSVGLSMAESFGGTAVETFDDAYKTAVKGGMNETQATEYAFDLAKESGTIAAVTTLATGKILKGNDFEKALFGERKGGNIAEAFDLIAKESVQEAFEEGLPKAWAETKLVQIDPTRDSVGNVTANVVLGMISGGGTTATIYGTQEGYNAVSNKLDVITTGDFVSSAVANFNPEVNSVIKNTEKTDENISVMEQDLTDLDVDSNIQANILNNFYDSSFISTEEVYNKYREFGDYKPEQSEVDRFVGKTSNEQFNTDFDAYIDPRFVDEQEIKDVAASEGVTLTDDQIKQYTGKNIEAEVLEKARKDLDPTAVTESEARKYLTDLGYTPTNEEVKQFTAQVSESEQAKKISEYVDPRMTTTDEAKSYFDALGYTANEDEINKYVGQIEEIKQKQAIGEYVDPKLVDEAEAFQAFKDAGLAEVRPEDARKLMGQYDETLLAGRVEEALPEARFNVIRNMIGKPATETEDATGLYAEYAKIPGLEQRLDDFKYTLEDQGQDLETIANIIGKPATQVTEADIDFVSDVIAQQETLADPTAMQFTDQMLQYDVSGDKKVDATDLQILQDLQAGRQPDFTQTTKFTEPTGIYDIVQDTSKDMKTLEQNIAAQFQRQAEEEAIRRAATARRGQQMDLARQLFRGLQPQTLTPQEPVKVAEIPSPYQFDTIFRDAGQEAFYQTPYNKGGQVDNLNDTLLKLIGEK